MKLVLIILFCVFRVYTMFNGGNIISSQAINIPNEHQEQLSNFVLFGTGGEQIQFNLFVPFSCEWLANFFNREQVGNIRIDDNEYCILTSNNSYYFYVRNYNLYGPDWHLAVGDNLLEYIDEGNEDATPVDDDETYLSVVIPRDGS